MFNEREEEKHRQAPQAAELRALSNQSRTQTPHIVVYINKSQLYLSIAACTWVMSAFKCQAGDSHHSATKRWQVDLMSPWSQCLMSRHSLMLWLSSCFGTNKRLNPIAIKDVFCWVSIKRHSSCFIGDSSCIITATSTQRGCQQKHVHPVESCNNSYFTSICLFWWSQRVHK